MLTIVNHYTKSLISRVMLYTALLFACLQNTYTQECPQGRITITSQTQLDSFVLTIQDCDSLDHIIIGNVDTIYGFDHIKRINKLTINGSNFKVLQGFNNLIEAGEISINNHHQTLRKIDGFRNLKKVRLLTIHANYQLSTLSGFDSLEVITFFLFNHFIGDSLNAFKSLKEIENNITIKYTGLRTLNGFSNLRKLGRPFTNISTRSYYLSISYNDLLTDISALDSLVVIPSITGYFSISFNGLLSACNTPMICNFLANRKGQVFISNNAPGCQSIQQVEQACISDTEEISHNLAYQIYPNPASDFLFMQVPEGRTLTEVKLTDMSGRMVMHQSVPDSMVDVSNVQSGVYILQLYETKGPISIHKVIIVR